MDFSKISFEDFENRIGKTSDKEIRAMVAEHGVKLPSHRMPKETLLRVAYDALTRSPAGAAAPVVSPAVADAAPAGPNPVTEPAGRRLRVRAIPGRALHERDGRWRCGRHWPPDRGVEVFENEFTLAEWQRLRADPMIEIIEVK